MAPAAKDRADQGRRFSRLLLSWTWRFSRSLSGPGEDRAARGQIFASPWPSPRVWSGHRENPLPPEDWLRTEQGVGRTPLTGNSQESARKSARMTGDGPRKPGLAQQMRAESPPAGGHNSDGPESSSARLHPANRSPTVSSRAGHRPAGVSLRPASGTGVDIRNRSEPSTQGSSTITACRTPSRASG